ncbi:MAG TPA: tetratricopeptide repeat protein, partial [Kofleriaceae bacterium]|nr:tetratricopeptide repeat protein [Kofleriaceae bacterium]
LCYRNELWQNVRELYRVAIEMVESGESRAFRLSDLYARLGQLQIRYLHHADEAARSYLRVVELDPESEEAIERLESIYVDAGQLDKLIAAYEKRAELLSDDGRRSEMLRRAAAIAATRLDDEAEAARVYQKLLDIVATDSEALDFLERYYDRNQHWDRLVGVLTARLAVVEDGNQANRLLRRVARICEEHLRDESRAIDHYQRILEVSPNNVDALEALGRIYESTERWTDFIDVTRRQIRVTTDRNVKALLYFKCGSVMEAKFGKQDEAIRYYDAAIKTSPTCLPAVHGVRDLYRRRADWPRVIQTLELEVKLWQEDKERAGVFAQIGRIYADHLGEPERALHYFESALAVDPECLPANRALFEQFFEAQDWQRAQPLAHALAQKAMREGDPHERSEFYRRYGIVARETGDLRAAAESLVIALEIMPDNMSALDELGDLVRIDPAVYDFVGTYRELEKIYRKRDGSHALLARVLITQARERERDGDLEAAEDLYAAAITEAPGDFAILDAQVDLWVRMRRFGQASEAIERFLAADPELSVEICVRALTRRAEIAGDGQMDPEAAIAACHDIINIAPDHQDAYYRLAQEHYLLGQLEKARACIDRAIELAAAPGAVLSPEMLARYYYYLGRILEAAGEARSAASQYRRAADYDPGYAPPALALARRATDANDHANAETLLINAAHEAMERGGPGLAVPLQRGLARVLLAAGDRAAAIEAYRGILAVESDGAADRVALAEVYALSDVGKAIHELKKIFDSDLRHGPAYRLLASYYVRAADLQHAARVLSVMEMLGYAEATDRAGEIKAQALKSRAPVTLPLTDELRNRLLVAPDGDGPVAKLWQVVGPWIGGLFPQPVVGENLAPVSELGDPTLPGVVAELSRLFGVEPEVYGGGGVPGGVVAMAYPRPIVVIDRELCDDTDAVRRFALGWAFDSIRGSYPLLLRLSERRRSELEGLLTSLLLPIEDRPGPTREFVASVPPENAEVIDSLAGTVAEPREWMEAMAATAKRAGLLAADDLVAATRMGARLAGDVLPVKQENTAALGLVLCGEDLIRHYLSDDYHQLREAIANSVG